MELKRDYFLNRSNIKKLKFNTIWEYNKCIENIQDSDNSAYCLGQLSIAFNILNKSIPNSINEWSREIIGAYRNLAEIYQQVYSDMEENARKKLSKILTDNEFLKTYFNY